MYAKLIVYGILSRNINSIKLAIEYQRPPAYGLGFISCLNRNRPMISQDQTSGLIYIYIVM